MCKDQRPTVSVTDMSGNKPEKVFSINLTTVEVYRSIAAIIITIVLSVGGFLRITYGWMVKTAQENFERRSNEVLMEGSRADRFIEENINHATHGIELRLIRIETLLNEVLEDRGDK